MCLLMCLFFPEAHSTCFQLTNNIPNIRSDSVSEVDCGGGMRSPVRPRKKKYKGKRKEEKKGKKKLVGLPSQSVFSWLAGGLSRLSE